MGDLDNFEKEYRRRAEKQVVIPSAELWERIEASLNSAGKKKIAFWNRHTSMAATAAMFAGLISLGIFYFNRIEEHLTVQNQAQSMESDIPAVFGADKSPGIALQVDANKVISGEIVKNAGAESNAALTESYLPEAQGRTKAEMLAYTPEQALFASEKVEIKRLFKNRSVEEWKENYNVDNSIFDNYEAQKERRRVEIGGAVSPVYSFRNTSNTGSANTITAMNSSYSEKGVLSTGGSVNIIIEMGKNWGIESGVRYTRMGQEVNTDIANLKVYGVSSKNNLGSIKTMSLENSMGNIKQQDEPTPSRQEDMFFANREQSLMVELSSAESAAQNGEFEQHIDYLEIPLTFRYYLLNNDTKLSLSAGISTNWLVGNSAYLIDSGNKQKIGQTEGISDMNFSTHAGLAFSVPLFGQFSFRLEPRINYFLNSVNEENPVKFKPYAAGLYTGIQYNLGGR